VQVERIRTYMLGGEWRTLREIKTALEAIYPPTVFPESSISAQLRNLKKQPYSYGLSKRRRVGVHGPGAGIWEYRLLASAQIQKAEKQNEREPVAARDTHVEDVGKPDGGEKLEEFLRETRRAVFPEST